MFKQLSITLGIICTILLVIIVIIFSTTFVIIKEQSICSIQVPDIQIIDYGSQPALTQFQERSKRLFQVNCASCHKRFKRTVGPALYGVTDRYTKEWLYKWINNSASLIQSGDAQAVAIFKEYNQANMNSFPNISQDEIDAILLWIEVTK